MTRRALIGMIALAALLCAGCTSFKRFAYEGFGRDGWQKPDEVVEALALEPGAQVADLGAGSGYFTFRLAEAVGAQGRVYAVDVDSAMNQYVADQARRREVENVEVVLAEPADPWLRESSVDLVFTCNTYHHIDERVQYFSRLRSALRRGGRVAVIDFDGSTRLVRWFGHWIDADTIRTEMEEAGYRLERDVDILPRQSFQIFAVAEPSE